MLIALIAGHSRDGYFVLFRPGTFLPRGVVLSMMNCLRPLRVPTAFRTRRPLGFALALVVLAVLVMACEAEEPETEEPVGADQLDDSDDDAEASPATDDQELVVGVGEDPWVASETNRKRMPNFPLQADVCETPVVMDTEFRTQEGLATDWEFVGDNTFRFTLNEDATFSDGSPVDAEALEYTIDYLQEEPSLAGVSDYGPDSVNIIDEHTIEITPEQPNMRLVEQMPHATNSVLGPGSDPLNDPQVLCSGPFQVEEYVEEERLVVVRNDNYWGEPAQLEKITFRFYPDDTARALALQGGEVDMISDVPRELVTEIEQLPGIKVEQSNVGLVRLIYVARRDEAGSDKPLADGDVRRAVAHAVDKQSFVDNVLAGQGEVVHTVTPPDNLGDHQDLIEGIPHDPDEAATLLDEAGWTLDDNDEVRTRDGEELDLTIIFSPNISLTTAEFIQAQLEEVGVTSSIDQLDGGAYSDRSQSGEYDLNIANFNQRNADPAFALGLRWSMTYGNPSSPWDGPGEDTEFERLIDEIHDTPDDDELRRLSAEATQELVHEEVAGIPLGGTYHFYGMREEVQGLEPHPSNTNQRWHTVYIEE